jgi:hypothetical protein
MAPSSINIEPRMRSRATSKVKRSSTRVQARANVRPAVANRPDKRVRKVFCRVVEKMAIRDRARKGICKAMETTITMAQATR